MCGLFVCARVREARKRGWGVSNFLGFLGIVGWGERGRKIFNFLGNLSWAADFLIFLGFKRDGDHYIFFLN